MPGHTVCMASDPDLSPENSLGTPDPEKSAALRAQLLATEHWSLLASRSTTQSEVLTRISIFLTLTSAGLVSLALMGQATKFSGVFPGFAIAVLAIVLVVGILSQLRVANVNMEDLQYVLAMNRLRAAYAELDPGIERFFMTSRFDDFAGGRQTYYWLTKRGASQVLGSSLVFIIAVNSTLFGLLLAALLSLWSASQLTAAIVGLCAGLVFFALSLWRATSTYFRFWKTYTPLFPGTGR